MPLLGIQRQKQNVKKNTTTKQTHLQKEKRFLSEGFIYIKNDYFMYNLFQNGYYNLCTI